MAQPLTPGKRFAEHAGAPWSRIGDDLPHDPGLGGEEFVDLLSLAASLLTYVVVAVFERTALRVRHG